MNITEVSQVHKVNTSIRSIYGSPYDINLVDKITGINRSDQLNGGYGVAKIDFDEATLYPFQYLTIKPQYYTKHYFIGKEHIATNFGNGGFEKVTPNTERKPETTHESQLIQWFYNKQWDDPYVFRTNTVGETTKNIDFQGSEFSDLQYKCDPTIVADLYASWRPRLHNIIGNNLGILNKQEEPYFYHNDHLGSNKLVTDARGRICNEIDYMPFGETFHSNGGHLHLEEHKFTGKERDEETQYDYFGARYYWSAAKHWLTVDPLSDKYPGISPYAYCGWNPINYVDPDGAKIVFASGTTSEQKLMFYQAVKYLNFHNCGGRYGQLSKSKYIYLVNMNVDKTNSVRTSTSFTINWNPTEAIEVDGKVVMSPAAVLNHEMTHATRYDDAINKYYNDVMTKGVLEANQHYIEYTDQSQKDPLNPYGNKEDESIITGVEQRTGKLTGEIKEGEVTRTNHSGNRVQVESSTSTTKVKHSNID